MEKTCIVIPCYNEGNRLPVKVFFAYLQNSPCSLCFVNDGSTDNTLAILESIKQKFHKQVFIVDLPDNVGKGEAVRQGVLNALGSNSFDHIGYFDADLATPLEEIEYLLSHFDDTIKIVLGSRVLRLGAVIDRSAVRHYLGRIFATLASNVLDMKVYDSQCGAKIFEVKIAQLLFQKPFISKWLFDLELLYRLKLDNSELYYNNTLEVPLRHWEEKGNSKIKIIDFVTAPFELLKIKRKTPLM